MGVLLYKHITSEKFDISVVDTKSTDYPMGYVLDEIECDKINCKLSEPVLGVCDNVTGVQSVEQHVEVQPSGGGTVCGTMENSRPCDVDCKLSGTFSDYDKICYTKPGDVSGKQYKSRKMVVTTQPKNKGKKCETVVSEFIKPPVKVPRCKLVQTAPEGSKWWLCDPEVPCPDGSQVDNEDGICTKYRDDGPQ